MSIRKHGTSTGTVTVVEQDGTLTHEAAASGGWDESDDQDLADENAAADQAPADDD